jgi:predicted small lipoprotein YifL
VSARALRWCGVAVLLAALAACGEKPQVMDMAAKKADAEPWTVSDAANPAFIAPGWKVGDRTSWEDQMRQRNQSQNDYAR